MMPVQEKYFQEKIIKPFEKEFRCRIKVVHYDDIYGLDSLLRQRVYPDAGLVKAPFEITQQLVSSAMILPLQKAATPEELGDIKKKYFLMDLTKFSGDYYYFPRKFETRVLVYLKSKVKDAADGWKLYKTEIDSLLKEFNNYGLPFNYALEPDPNQWDFYDMFVAGYFWRNAAIYPEHRGRIGHRGRRYAGTAQRILDRALSLGANPDDLLKMNHSAVFDAFTWEALNIKEGLLAENGWKQGWAGKEIWEAFGRGEVFISFMTQIDCFFLHGTSDSSMTGYIKDKNDFGVALMPRGVSLALTSDGQYLREGSRKVSTGGWWWGIPQYTPFPDLSVKLAEWILKPENQIDECGQFGMIPVRKDILEDISLIFGRGWISEVFNVSFKQLMENRYTALPLVKNFNRISDLYLDAWMDICVGQTDNNPTPINKIPDVIMLKYIPKAEEIGK
jgi:ABC-type glycerol-3-phosphate transport system substrate-binding protein